MENTMDKQEKLEIAQRRLNNIIATWNNGLAGVTGIDCGEIEHVKSVLSTLGISKGFFVDIAASDGVAGSCTKPLLESGWSGLAFEMNPDYFSQLSFAWADFPAAKLARTRVIPRNVGHLLRGFEVPADFDFLNLDIDSYDLKVLEAILAENFRPKFISMEINEKIPPPVYFTVLFDEFHYWKLDHFFGCSLTAAAHSLKKSGYILESLQCNNAMFIRSDVASGFFADRDVEEAYNIGYRDSEYRHTTFRHNRNTEEVFNLTPQEIVDFYNAMFTNYKGLYELRAAP